MLRDDIIVISHFKRETGTIYSSTGSRQAELVQYRAVSFGLLISSWCRIYASVNRVSIGSDNGLSAMRNQAII